MNAQADWRTRVADPGVQWPGTASASAVAVEAVEQESQLAVDR